MKLILLNYNNFSMVR